MHLELRAEHISNEVCAQLPCLKAILSKLVLHAAALRVELEVGFDPDQWRKVVDASETAAENIEACNDREIGVNVNKRKVHRQFELRIVRSGFCGCVLRPGDQGDKCESGDCNALKSVHHYLFSSLGG